MAAKGATKYSSRLLVLASIELLTSPPKPPASAFADVVNAKLVDALSTECMLAGNMLVREDTISELFVNGPENCPSLFWEDSPTCERRIII